jgi:hypothetical protein
VVPPRSDRISRVPPYSRMRAYLRLRGYHPLRPDFPDRSTSSTHTTGLFRVRSPLLAESLLMSFPPGTEMFQFPGFASPAYVFSWRYPCGWVAPFGYPRIKACSRLPMAFRSVPRPSSPPGAKASTECPYRARYQNHPPREQEMALLSPCTGTITPHPDLTSKHEATLLLLHSKQSLSTYPTPLNPASAIRGTTLDASQHHDPFRSDSHARRQRTPHIRSSNPAKPDPNPNPSCPARPGAHQNLIHNTKEQ